MPVKWGLWPYLEKNTVIMCVLSHSIRSFRLSCAGVHMCRQPETIGTFKIMSEGSISAGIRRIEAVTGEGAESFLHDQVFINREIAELMKGPKDLVQSIKQLLDQKNTLEKELQKAQQEKVGQTTEALKGKVRDIHGHKVILEQINLPASDALKQIGFELRKTMPDTAVILAADIEGKPQIAVVLPDALVANELHAGKIGKGACSRDKRRWRRTAVFCHGRR